MSAQVRSRIAPTPSGMLHVGNAYNFLLTAWLTRQLKGSLRLRIDDLDAPRIRQAYLDDIFDTLHWLNIACDEGPENVAEHRNKFSQQLRLDQYNHTLRLLVDSGQVFACTCSRKEIAVHSADGQYPGTCIHKKMPLNTPGSCWRMVTRPGTIVHCHDAITGIQAIDLYQSARHFIIRRKEGIPAYHIASLTDDVDFGINLIVRGRDLLESTAIQLYLAQQLQHTSFLNGTFYHHPLIQDPAGEKLSKSAGSTSVQFMRKNGVSLDAFMADFNLWRRSYLNREF